MYGESALFCDDLWEKLWETDYKKNNFIFTVRLVSCIPYYLGATFINDLLC